MKPGIEPMSPALQAVSCVTSRFFLQLNHQRSPPSASGHVGSFHVLAVVNSAIMSTGVHVSFDLWFPLDGVAGPYVNSIFSFSRNFHIVLHSGCTSLHSHQ